MKPVVNVITNGGVGQAAIVKELTAFLDSRWQELEMIPQPKTPFSFQIWHIFPNYHSMVYQIPERQSRVFSLVFNPATWRRRVHQPTGAVLFTGNSPVLARSQLQPLYPFMEALDEFGS